MGPDPTDKSILIFYPDNAGTSFLPVNRTMTTPTDSLAGKKTDKNARAISSGQDV
jgi:hypothetical protein